MTAAEVAAALGKNESRTVSGWRIALYTKTARHLSHSKGGKLLVHCHAGCPQETVVRGLRARGLWPLTSEYGVPAGTNRRSETNLVSAAKIRRKREGEGFVVAGMYYFGRDIRKVRFEHQHKLQNGKMKPVKTYIWNIPGPVLGTRETADDKSPYINGAFRSAATAALVLGVEGERKVDVAGELGIPAFSFHRISPESAKSLKTETSYFGPTRIRSAVRRQTAHRL